MIKILVDNKIEKAIEKGRIQSYFGDSLIPNIQPSSIDLPIGDVGYNVKRKFRAFKRRVGYVAKSLAFETLDLDKKKTTLYKGQTYLFPCLKVNLPKDIHLEFSPKSSIGRIDLSVKMLADETGLYDWTPAGYKGEIWMEVTPKSFNVTVEKGVTLTQMKVVKEESYELDISKDKELVIEGQKNTTYFDRNTIVLGLNVPNGEMVGYEAKETNEPIDMTQKGNLDPAHFFRPISSEKRDHGKIELQKDHFYILATKNKVAVPPKYSAEMLPISHLVDDLRAHYAGYFDPGFGYGKDAAAKGNTGVLEVRPFETITCYDNQPIVMFRYYLNDGVCDDIYGAKGNNYAKQGSIRLAKYFRG